MILFSYPLKNIHLQILRGFQEENKHVDALKNLSVTVEYMVLIKLVTVVSGVSLYMIWLYIPKADTADTVGSSIDCSLKKANILSVKSTFYGVVP